MSVEADRAPRCPAARSAGEGAPRNCAALYKGPACFRRISAGPCSGKPCRTGCRLTKWLFADPWQRSCSGLLGH